MRGWLIFEFGGLFGFVRFNSHSVIEQQDGTLIDITPSRASRRYPFIRHAGSEEDFIELVVKWQVIQFDYRVT